MNIRHAVFTHRANISWVPLKDLDGILKMLFDVEIGI